MPAYRIDVFGGLLIVSFRGVRNGACPVMLCTVHGWILCFQLGEGI